MNERLVIVSSGQPESVLSHFAERVMSADQLRCTDKILDCTLNLAECLHYYSECS